jgi:hypothetical protein
MFRLQGISIAYSIKIIQKAANIWSEMTGSCAANCSSSVATLSALQVFCFDFLFVAFEHDTAIINIT